MFLTRVVLRNYKSIRSCDVRLGPLTFLVGANGSGKSNFLDALQFVSDALTTTLDIALNKRGGFNEVLRRSNRAKTEVVIDLTFDVGSASGRYAFALKALKEGGYEVARESFEFSTGPVRFDVRGAKLVGGTEPLFPKPMRDRLTLVAASGLKAFRFAYDHLASMRIYSVNPQLMRAPQPPQDGTLLKPTGENIASVIANLQRTAPARLAQIEELLGQVLPSLTGLRRTPSGVMEKLEFDQRLGTNTSLRFLAQNMSDGTLRALGVLVALFQADGNRRPMLIGIEEPETALHPAGSGVIGEAIALASETAQVLVTSHGPDLLDDDSITIESLLAVEFEGGETVLAPIDPASRRAIKEKLFTPGELLRLGQLRPDAVLSEPIDL
jgi:predicted ATPase